MADAARIAFVVRNPPNGLVTAADRHSGRPAREYRATGGNTMVSRMLRYPATVFGDRVALVDIHRSAIVSNVMLDFAGSVHVPVTWSLTCLFSRQERGAVAGVQSRDDPCQ